MCRLTTVASALLALAVINAAPLTTPPPNGDQCGPTVQIPGDPADTCKAQPTLVPPGGSPGAYSITPIASIVGPSTRYDPSTCDPVIDELCKTMAGANVTLGKWYFSSNEGTNEGTNEVGGPYGCQMGFYLPAQEGAAPKPATVGEDGNAGNQCKNILGAIRWAARGQPVTSTDFGAETVNLVMPPVGVEGMWPMLGDQNRGRTDGQAVNAGYPSYIWQHQWRPVPVAPPPGYVPQQPPPGNQRTDSAGRSCDSASADETCFDN